MNLHHRLGDGPSERTGKAPLRKTNAVAIVLFGMVLLLSGCATCQTRPDSNPGGQKGAILGIPQRHHEIRPVASRPA